MVHNSSKRLRRGRIHEAKYIWYICTLAFSLDSTGSVPMNSNAKHNSLDPTSAQNRSVHWSQTRARDTDITCREACFAMIKSARHAVHGMACTFIGFFSTPTVLRCLSESARSPRSNSCLPLCAKGGRIANRVPLDNKKQERR